MALVPKHYFLIGSTRDFGGNDVPELLLERHKTRVGFYCQIEVIEGELLWYGYCEKDGEPVQEVRLKTKDRAMSHPRHLHRLEPLTEDTRFRLNVFAHESLHDVNADAGTTVGLFLEGETSEPEAALTEDTDCGLQAHR